MLKTHLRAPNQPKIEINIKYEDSKKHSATARILRAIGLLDMLAEHAADRWAWPHPLTVEARSCGMANARWSRRTLTLCYELVDQFIEFYLRYSKTLPRK